MKRVYTFLLLFSLGSVTFQSCSTSKATKGILGGGPSIGGTVVKSVATVVGLIVLSKLIKSILSSVTKSTAFASLSDDKSFINNFNENTKISSFAKGDFMKTALQLLVAEHYQIPLTKVTNSFNSLNTVGELATFVGENGSAKVLQGIK